MPSFVKDKDSFFGYSLFSWNDLPFHEDYNLLFAYLSDLGIDNISVSSPFYQNSLESNLDEPRLFNFSSGQLEEVIEHSRQNKAKVLLRPYLFLETGEWQGLIKPQDYKKWFKNYADVLCMYASFAEANKDVIEKFSIGVELRSMEKYSSEWINLIKSVRKEYNGEITYCANFDSYDKVSFWNELDFIGIDAYFPMPSNRLEDMIPAWEIISVKLNEFSKINDKRVEFSEFGCKSVNKASLNPFNHAFKNVRSDVEQFNYYNSFCVSSSPVDLVYIWDLDGPDNDASTGYSIQGKRVEKLVRAFNKKN